MVREIVQDVLFLSRKSSPASREDAAIGQDLLDTLAAHRDDCVGMAANMIGFSKCIIAVNLGFVNVLMYNPEILEKKGPYQTQEGCLSLSGIRSTQRYREITLAYLDAGWNPQRQTFTGWPAQIIQHEIDHLQGILI